MGDAGHALEHVDATRLPVNMRWKKLISLFLLIFTVLVLFYLIWIIGRGYPLERHFALGTYLSQYGDHVTCASWQVLLRPRARVGIRSGSSSI